MAPLTSVILAIQEAKIRRITVQSQHRQIAVRPYLRKKEKKKKQERVGGVVQGEFKHQYPKKENQKQVRARSKSHVTDGLIKNFKQVTVYDCKASGSDDYCS
jgi:hypothetical protein